MAKFEDKKVENEKTQQVVDSMPVEKLQNTHHHVANNPHQALQAGREFKANDGILGEIEKIIHEAEKAGNHSLSGEFAMVLLKVGELITYLVEAEKIASEVFKPFYARILALFKK